MPKIKDTSTGEVYFQTLMPISDDDFLDVPAFKPVQVLWKEYPLNSLYMPCLL